MFDKDAVFHYCTNDKTRPYPTLLCSCCKPNSTALDERDFNAYEKVKQLQAENKALREEISKSITAFQEQPAVQATGNWQTGMFCGLEDRDITDRYDACMYGHDKALDKVMEWVIAPLEQALKGN